MVNNLALVIWRTYPLIWLPFGTIGNCMTVIVLVQHRNRDSSIARYLTVLAVADLIVLWVALPRNLLYYGYGIDLRSFSETICQMQLFLLYFACNSSASLVVIVTTERFISTWLPLKVKGICTPRKANIVITIMAATLAVLNSVVFYGMGHTEGINTNGTNSTHGKACYPKDERYAHFMFNIWPVIQLVLFSFAPVTILLILNIAIIIRILTMRKGSRARQDKSYQATAMLITLNVSYMVFVTPLLAFLIMYSEWVLSYSYGQNYDELELAWAIVNALFYMNSSVNFILYFISGSKFRKEAKRLFCRGNKS